MSFLYFQPNCDWDWSIENFTAAEFVLFIPLPLRQLFTPSLHSLTLYRLFSPGDHLPSASIYFPGPLGPQTSPVLCVSAHTDLDFVVHRDIQAYRAKTNILSVTMGTMGASRINTSNQTWCAWLSLCSICMWI